MQSVYFPLWGNREDDTAAFARPSARRDMNCDFLKSENFENVQIVFEIVSKSEYSIHDGQIHPPGPQIES